MLQLNFDPFPILETERLQMRKITLTDAEDFLVLRSDVDAMKYIDRPKPKTIEDIYELIAKISGGIKDNNSIGWAITIKGESKLIGSITTLEHETDQFLLSKFETNQMSKSTNC